MNINLSQAVPKTEEEGTVLNSIFETCILLILKAAMFTAAPFTNSQGMEATLMSSADEQMNKSWYIHTAKYYSYVNLENVMLSERNQTQKVTYYVISFISNF